MDADFAKDANPIDEKNRKLYESLMKFASEEKARYKNKCGVCKHLRIGSPLPMWEYSSYQCEITKKNVMKNYKKCDSFEEKNYEQEAKDLIYGTSM